MTDFTREAFYRIDHENILLKAKYDELLGAAKAIHRFRSYDKSYPEELQAWEHLEATIEKIEGHDKTEVMA